MPSFDIVSEVDMHEVGNAVDQANREISVRFDFRGSDASFEHKETEILLHADSTFQLSQMLDVLWNKMVKRNVSVESFEVKNSQPSGKQVKQQVVVKQGIEQPVGKKMIKDIKTKKLKVQAAIAGEQVRVTGKKRDDLQNVIAFLKQEDYGLPLQFKNFRD